jgi:hypothetical protein
MLLQDVCKGTDVKTVHDVISVFRRDTSGMTSFLLDEAAKLMKLFMVLAVLFMFCRAIIFCLETTENLPEIDHDCRTTELTVLHIHKELTADLNIDDLMKEFVSANNTRRAMFGAVYDLISAIGMHMYCEKFVLMSAVIWYTKILFKYS